MKQDKGTIFLRDLPPNITGEELDERLLNPYQIEAIDFLTEDNTIAAVSFVDDAEAKRAYDDLIGVCLNDVPVLVSFQ
jgi:hypothetical protein